MLKRRNNSIKVHSVRNNWAGNRVVGGQYVNLIRKPKAIKSIYKWNPFSKKTKSKFKNLYKRWHPEIEFINNTAKIRNNTMIWLGHNSFIINIGGKRLVLDPVFGHIPFVKRRSDLPLDPNNLLEVDLILLSHDHYDHTDKKSIKLLAANNTHIQVICGLGSKKLLNKWVPHVNVYELGWYQKINFGSVIITFLPSQHWGKRYLSDSAKRLWGSFMLEYDNKKIYYSGDTAFSSHFEEVHQLFGNIDYVLIGIGAYQPRWFLERNHISPQEAVRAAKIMGAKCTIPMHYGTFKLSQEPLFDPPIVFKAEAIKYGVNILVPKLGEIINLK